MKKQILVLGTSHTEGVCEPVGGDDFLPREQRWWSYLEREYDAEVTVLARVGATSLQQWFALSNYIYDNPDKKFDFGIVEGRIAEYTMDIPEYQADHLDQGKKLPWHEERYARWIEDSKRKYPEREEQLFTSISSHYIESMKPKIKADTYSYYMYKYSNQPMHFANLIMTNYAICNTMAKVCNDVKWYCHATIGDDFIFTEWEDLFRFYMKEYIMEGVYPTLTRPGDDRDDPKNEKYYCPCGHFNELGVKEVAWKRLKPCFDEYLKDS